MNPLRSILVDGYVAATMPLRSAAAYSQRKRRQAPVAVLFYHRVADSHPTPWSIDCQTFRSQVEWMAKRFDFVSLSEARLRIAGGNERPCVTLTFDDGYHENSEWAIPWLIDRRIPVTYFVSTGFVGSKQGFPHDIELGLNLPPHDLPTLKSWVGTSIEFGGHTRTHADLGRCTSAAKLIDELVVASADLQRMLGASIRDFAFPYGHPENLHPWAFEIARRAGFNSVCSAYGELNRVGDDPFHLRRIHGDPALSRLRNALTDDPRRWLRKPHQAIEHVIPEHLEVPTLDDLLEQKKSSGKKASGAVLALPPLEYTAPQPPTLR